MGNAAGQNEQTKRKSTISMRLFGVISFVLACVLSLAAIFVAWNAISVFDRAMADDEQYIHCEAAVDDLSVASDYLTSQSRMYVITGDRRHLDNYLDEVNVTNRRGIAVEILRENGDPASFSDLEQALNLSNELAERELFAMRLAADARNATHLPDDLENVSVPANVEAMGSDEKLAYANKLLLGAEYDEMKQRITRKVDAATDDLIVVLHERIEASDTQMVSVLSRLTSIVIALLVIILGVAAFATLLIAKPIRDYSKSIKRGDRLDAAGVTELRYLADAYNVMYEESANRTKQLQRIAEHDSLTDLKNRGAYDAFLLENDQDIALIVIDVDQFKEFNDKLGHNVGDAVLKKVADAIRASFRSSDFLSRIGGDEFAIIMTDMRPDLKGVVIDRIEMLKAQLNQEADGLPPVTLSIGVAFNGEGDTPDDIFRKADRALYQVKEHGRNGYAFAETDGDKDRVNSSEGLNHD